MSNLIQKEDLVQAIVIADNFCDAFAPITDATPIVRIKPLGPQICYNICCFVFRLCYQS